MAITVNLPANNVDSTANNFINVSGTLTFSGSYATGGDTLDFTPVMSLIPTSQAPIQIFAQSQNGSFNAYVPVQGSSFNNWKLKIAAPGGTEIAAGAYPASVTGDIVTWQGIFRKFL